MHTENHLRQTGSWLWKMMDDWLTINLGNSRLSVPQRSGRLIRNWQVNTGLWFNWLLSSSSLFAGKWRLNVSCTSCFVCAACRRLPMTPKIHSHTMSIKMYSRWALTFPNLDFFFVLFCNTQKYRNSFRFSFRIRIVNTATTTTEKNWTEICRALTMPTVSDEKRCDWYGKWWLENQSVKPFKMKVHTSFSTSDGS